MWGDRRSGNCYKVAWLLRQLDRDFEWRETDVLTGATRKPGFTALNPNGKVPLLRLPGGRLLSESNAMLLHLAEDTRYLPGDDYDRALAYQWLFFEQYSHEPYIAVRRFLLHFDHGQAVARERLDMLMERGCAALAVMDKVLDNAPWFAGPSFSIADLALYAYTHVAADGGFDLAGYPAVLHWLARVRGQPGHFDLEEFKP
ncbi:MAG: glutathione S-transferase family protein [Xanthomonadales bacterium]|nr:glutathione S-transferase family protein [Xanthomonadales bacterium]